MIATIVGSIVVLLCIGVIIVFHKEAYSGNVLGFGFGISIAAIFIAAMSITAGYAPRESTYTKEQICLLLRHSLSTETIKLAENYNENLEFGNNYWCRFTLRDLSEDRIDIDYYLTKEAE